MKTPGPAYQENMEHTPSERNYSFFEFWIKYLRTYISFALDRPIKNRKDIPILLRILNLNGKGAEVGVLWGAFSKIILENSKLATVYLIDPWIAQSKESYNDNSNAPVGINEARYQKVVDDFKVYGNRSEIMRATSEEASGQFQDKALDFVYIDANHSYEAVTQDIQLWWPKIKRGGIMGGHDYFNGGPHDFGVKSAVDEFASKYSQRIYVIKADWPSWYIIKKN